MNQFKNYTLTVVGCVIVVLTLAVNTNVGYTANKDVNVVNTPENPALVRDVDKPSPFSASCGGNNCTFPVPAGKRLVIESVSGEGNIEHGKTLLIRLRGTPASGQASGSFSSGFFLIVPVAFQFTNDTFDFYGFNQRTLLQVEPNGVVVIIVLTEGHSQTMVNLSGYLVSVEE